MISTIPTVSVVICVFNGADTIADTILSLINQDYPIEYYEIIIVDNLSTDNTVEIVKKYPVHLYHCNKRGIAPARNFGINNSSAEIIALTDADCVAAEDWLSELMKPYEDPNVGGVGGAIKAYEHSNRTYVELFSDEFSPLVNYISGSDEYLPHLYTANASYRRRLINLIGGFNEELITAQDVDFAWQLQLRSEYHITYSPNAVIYHHHRTTQEGLARQYRRYGYGEILLDTMYKNYPNYPRSLSYQFKRIIQHLFALPRYLFSYGIRQIKLHMGKIDPYTAQVPILWFVIESNTLKGKIEGLIATRFMRNPESTMLLDAGEQIDHYFAGE